MPEKDITIHLRAKGAEETRRLIEEVAAAQEKVGNAAVDAGRKAVSAADDFDQMQQSSRRTDETAGSLIGKIGRWASSLALLTVAIREASAALREQVDLMRESVQLQERQHNAFLQLQLADRFLQQNPEARKTVAQLSVEARRPFEEVASAWYLLQQRGADLTAEQQMKIFKEAIESGYKEPQRPLESIVQSYLTMMRQTGIQDPRRIQNLLTDLLAPQELHRVLPIGLGAGLTTEQTLGMLNFLTQQMGDPTLAASGLVAVLRGLTSKEARAQLEERGIATSGGILNILQQMSQQPISMETMEGLVGGTMGTNALLNLLKKPKPLAEAIQKMEAAGATQKDILSERVAAAFSADPITKLMDEYLATKRRIEAVKAQDVTAAQYAVEIESMAAEDYESKIPAYLIQLQRRIGEKVAAMGVSPKTFFERLQEGLMKAGTVPGYSFAPVEIHEHRDVHYHLPDPGNSPRVGEFNKDGRYQLETK
ncbi:MAG TPA: hypothetical protein PKY88_13160 [Anaerohalosphaeraceae bacterium]|nr:hypothetical protein [Anaerohalosphaeraceae bacterium]